jgi:hypothetical protein
MLNISSAFRLRNQLKEKIAEMAAMRNAASIDKTVGEEENRKPFDGKTYQQNVEESIRLMDLLFSFNQAIEKANEANRMDLLARESLQSKMALYSCLVSQCRKHKGYDYEYPEAREDDIYERPTKVKVLKELVLDQDALVKKLQGLKKSRIRLDEKLARSNEQLQVDFDERRVQEVL